MSSLFLRDLRHRAIFVELIGHSRMTTKEWRAKEQHVKHVFLTFDSHWPDASELVFATHSRLLSPEIQSSEEDELRSISYQIEASMTGERRRQPTTDNVADVVDCVFGKLRIVSASLSRNLNSLDSQLLRLLVVMIRFTGVLGRRRLNPSRPRALRHDCWSVREAESREYLLHNF